MSKRLKTILYLGIPFLLILLACALTTFPKYAILEAYAALNPDQTVFIGDMYVQYSAVNHTDKANWDMVATKNPPIYLGAQAKNCQFEDKDDSIFTATGIWVARWQCHP